MNGKTERLFGFIMKEKTRRFLAFVLYVSIVGTFMEVELPLLFGIIDFFMCLFAVSIGVVVYLDAYLYKISENRGKIKKELFREAKKIAREIFMFIPVLLIRIGMCSFIMIGTPENQVSVNANFYENPISASIFGIVIAPIIEEIIFRFLPYRFIKNKFLYISISAVVFAMMHVVDDTNALYYIWFYMIGSLYYSYRYYKTKDVWVTISIHSFNNLTAALMRIL